MMAARWEKPLIWLAALLGMGHTALTPLEHPDWSIEALWFAGTGLAMLAAACANAVGLTSTSGSAHYLLAALNCAMTAYFAAAWTVLPAPQVIVGGLVFAGLAGLGLVSPGTPR